MNADPIYTVRHAFEAEPICSVFGFDGLVETIPRLEPDIYVICDGSMEIGSAIRHTDARDWSIDMDNGVRASPGFVIV